MFYSIPQFLISLALLIVVNATSIRPATEVIIRDFVVIGGGSTGTYSAIRLKDLKHSVVVVEKKAVLGGHCETYIDPYTKTAVDIGVVSFYNNTVVTDYFSKFNVPLVPLNPSQSTFVTSDLRTGESVDPVIYSATQISEALSIYAEQLSKYPYLNTGFDLPSPVPEDLLIPFGDFVQKYQIQAVVPLWYAYGQGLGNFLDHSTLAVFKRLGLGVVSSFQSGFLTAKDGCHSLYDAALASLGDNVLLSTTITAAIRNTHDSKSPIVVTVSTPRGLRTIHAKKIIFTAPPKLSNFAGFDLDEEERSVFSRFNNTGYYTALVTNTGLADNIQIANAAQSTPFQLPVLPGPFDIQPTAISGVKDIYYGIPNETPLSDGYVKVNMITSLQNYQRVHNYTITEPTFLKFSGHTPFDLRPSVDDIKHGFYRRLGNLQGRNSMYYTGGAFHTYDSSALWAFTENLLDKFTEDF